jgi:hypothetical protein
MPETSSFPIFLRATMPQVQSPGTGEGLGCGRFRVYLATERVVLESKADMQKRGQASPAHGSRRRPGGVVVEKNGNIWYATEVYCSAPPLLSR